MNPTEHAVETILKKTRAGSLNWNKHKALVKEATLFVSLAENEPPKLTIYCEDDSRCFQSDVVNQLYETVLEQEFFAGSAAELQGWLDDL